MKECGIDGFGYSFGCGIGLYTGLEWYVPSLLVSGFLPDLRDPDGECRDRARYQNDWGHSPECFSTTPNRVVCYLHIHHCSVEDHTVSHLNTYNGFVQEFTVFLAPKQGT